MKKVLWLVLGWFALALGTLGIILPILPTTPFYLLAATCFMKGSKKLYRWMITHKTFGPSINHYVQDRIISRQTKLKALTLLWISLAASAFIISKIPITMLLLVCGGCVSYYIGQHKESRSL